MTNISNQDTSDKGGKFAPGAVVALKTEVQFVDGTYDSDDLFVVLKNHHCGVTILSNGVQLTVANAEIRLASPEECLKGKRSSKGVS
ncbi:hypothetical protein LF296_12835 [Acinetobacter vivianii]|uniref:Uncharacterized protein n=1 Tax=Acinetobacter vivianii TaxID=1776742 RepID=A0AAJ6NH14_9GAMM|nr:hypothetical protein [Acinetobacter vivianii]WDZ50206.1 hypothetical protein LF296_12835 [Acinetobacter vivianii]